jgi:hypothetical protein
MVLLFNLHKPFRFAFQYISKFVARSDAVFGHKTPPVSFCVEICLSASTHIYRTFCHHGHCNSSRGILQEFRVSIAGTQMYVRRTHANNNNDDVENAEIVIKMETHTHTHTHGM